MACLQLLALASCGPGGASGGADAGDGGVTTPDAAGSKLCPTPTTCDDTKVRICRDGHVEEVIEECGPELTCSLGRCASNACADAERATGTVVGCSFYAVHLDNVDSDDPLPSSLVVTNPGQTPARATLETRVGGRWTDFATVTVPPMRASRVAMPEAFVEGPGAGVQLALRLVTDAPVTVLAVQSDDTGGKPSRGSGATMLLPESALGRRYRAIAYPQLATPAVLEAKGARGGAAQLVIVGTEDRTTVTVKPSPTAMFDPGSGAPPLGPSGTFRLSLDDGDYQQIYTVHDGADLTGTEITADKPVAVFSGNVATTYGQIGIGINSADLAHEQLLPTTAWGFSYVAAALAPRPGVCDSLYDTGVTSIWRIVADKANTTVDFSPPPGVTGPFARRVLGAGEILRLFVPVDVSFGVRASAPIEIMQGMDCEATLASAVPADPLVGDLWFAALPTFDAAIAVVRKAGEPVFLDEGRVDEAEFKPAGMGFEVAELPVADCPASQGACAHHLAGHFGVTMRGEDVLTSWSFTVPSWRPCSEPDVTNCSM